MRAAPETIRQLPWIYRLMRTASDDERSALLFAAPEVEQPQVALAGTP